MLILSSASATTSVVNNVFHCSGSPPLLTELLQGLDPMCRGFLNSFRPIFDGGSLSRGLEFDVDSALDVGQTL